MVRQSFVMMLVVGLAVPVALGQQRGQQDGNAQPGNGQQGNGQMNNQGGNGQQWQNGQGNAQLQQRLGQLQQRLQQQGIDLQQVQQNLQQRLQERGIDPQQMQQQLIQRLQQAGVDTQQLQQQLEQAGLGQGGLLGGIGGGMAVFVDPTTEMERVLTDLTEDQKAQLKDKAAAAQAATNDFRTQSNTKMQDLQQTGDQQAMQDMREMQQKDSVALQFKNSLDIESVLTADQKNTWEAYLLAKLIKQKLQAAGLTKEQTDKVDAMVKDAGKDIVAAAADPDAKNKVAGTVYKRVLDDVVTDDQFGVLVGVPR
jgi:hypothetical protein